MSSKLNDWWQQWLITADEATTRASSMLRSPRRDVTPKLKLSSLEPRILFSATPIDPASLMGGDETAMVVEVEAPSQPTSDEATIETLAEAKPREQSVREIVFVDSQVPQLQQLLDDLSGSGRDAKVVVLDVDRDGIDQITETLDAHTGVASVHIISHAEDGAVRLGKLWLGQSNLDGYAGQIASWQSALSADADILLYGCDLAGGADGRALVEAISVLTGADVAASTDDTGHAKFAGNWNLEYSTGVVESEVVLSTELQEAWIGKLAIITVDTFDDEILSNGLTSLREAIIQANAGGGDTIVLSAGTYTLTLGTSGEDDALEGDLDINQDITIVGAGTTVIDGGGIDRVFEIRTGGRLSMSEVTVTGGIVGDKGGGINVKGDADLNLTRVKVIGNIAAEGAGIYNEETANLTDVVIEGNGDAGTISGGGFYNKGIATLDHVTVAGNQADSGAGLYTENGASRHLDLVNVTVSGNTAMSSGGGLYATGDATILNSTFTLNDAGNAAGIRIQGGGSVDLQNTIIDGNLSSVANPDVQGSFNSLGFNLIGDTTGGSGFIASDITGQSALLAGLSDNGGFGKTHALQSGSLAINGGTNSGAPAGDARQFARRDGRVDIGSYEADAVEISKIYWTDESTGKIQRANLDGTDVEDLVTGLAGTGVAGLFVDTASGKMYWAERWGGAIRRANLDGSGIEDVVAVTANPREIAVDAAAGKIYWTEDGLADNKIHRANLDGSGVEDLITIGLSDPGGIELDPQAGKIYWVDTVANKVQRADLDGSNIEDLVVGLNGPRRLKLDLSAGKMYWTDDGLGINYISRANLDGSSVENLVTTGLLSPAGIELDLQTGKIYWTDFSTNKMQMSDLDGSNVQDVITSGLAGPIGLALGGTEPTVATNIAPSANAGGVYTISEGQQLELDGSASDDLDGTIVLYEWDLDNDGTFGDVVGAGASISWSDLSADWGIDDGDVAGTAYTIGLRVTDDAGKTATSTTTVTVFDVAPTLLTTGTGTAVAGVNYTLQLAATDDGADTISSWTINWGDGTTTTHGAVSSVDHVYTVSLTYNILVSATNEDGTWHQAGALLTSAAVDPNDGVYRVEATSGNYVIGSLFGGNELADASKAIVGPDGNLYVGSFASNKIEQFDPETGTHLGTFVDDADLTRVSGFAFGPDGNLYVASYSTGEVHRYNGTTGGRLDASGTPFISGLNGPIDLLFHTDGNLYVSNYDNSTIQRFNATTGTPIADPGGAFVQTGTLDGPEYMAFGPGGYLYVASHENNSVYRFDTDGSNVDGLGAYISGSGLDGPAGLAFGPDGYLYVSSEHSSTVRRYDVSGPTAIFVDDYVSVASITDNVYLVFQPGHQVTVSDSAPTDIAPNAFSINENVDTTGGTSVGTLTATDPDVGDTLTYTIVGGADQSKFSIGGIGNELILDDGILNFESKDSYSVLVRVTDTDLNIYEELLTVAVNDLNEAPTVTLTPVVSSLNEDVATSSAIVVATIAINDDGLGNVTTSLSGDDAGLFEIVGTDLRLKAGTVLDFETNSSLDVAVHVNDATITGNPDDVATHTIAIGDVNEAPIADAESYSVRAGDSLSTSAPGVLDGDYDPDGDFITAVLLTGPTRGTLTLHPDGSFVYTPNAGFQGTDSFLYQAWDGSASSAATLVKINVSPAIIIFPALPPVNPIDPPTPDPSDDPVDDQNDQDDDGGEGNGVVSVTPPGSGDEPGRPSTNSSPDPISEIVSANDISTQTNSGSPIMFESLQIAGADESVDRDRQAKANATNNGNREIRSTVDQLLAAAAQVNYALMTSPGVMWNELDQQLEHVESQIHGDLIVVGAAGAAASSFTVGVVAWALRTGFLASGLLAQMPAWRAVDPLLIMQGFGKNENEETLEELMKRESQSLDG